MDLSEKEKEVEQALLKQWPPGRALRIWNLYLSIKGGKKKTVANLQQCELDDIDILWEKGLIYYERIYWLGQPYSVQISALPFDQPEDGLTFL